MIKTAVYMATRRRDWYENNQFVKEWRNTWH